MQFTNIKSAFPSMAIKTDNKTDGKIVGHLLSFLILSVIFTIGGFGQASAQSRPRPIGGGFYQMRLPTESAPLEQNQELDVSVVGKLPISGTLTIEVRDVKEVTVDISAAFRADGEDQASETMSTSGARLSPTDDGMRLKVKIDPSVWSIMEGEKLNLEMVVTVPLATRIFIEAPYLQVNTEGPLEQLTIDETFEPVDIRGARGTIRVDSHNSKISVNDLIGGFDLQTSNARITLTDIEISQRSSNSEKFLPSRADTEDGRIEIRRYKGPLQVRTSRERIRIRDISLMGKRSWIENTSGLITAEFSKVGENAQLEVTNSYEDILLTFRREISAFFSLRTSDGKPIEIENLEHRIVNVRKDKIEAECGDGQARVIVRAKYGGSIKIDGKP